MKGLGGASSLGPSQSGSISRRFFFNFQLRTIWMIFQQTNRGASQKLFLHLCKHQDTSGRIERLQVMVLVQWRGRHNTWHLTMRLDIFGSFMASGFRGGDCGHRYSGPWEIGVFAFLGGVLVEFGGEHWNPGKLRMKTPGCEGVLIYQQVNWNVTRVLNSALVALIPQSKTSVLKWLETYKHATYYVFIQYVYI